MTKEMKILTSFAIILLIAQQLPAQIKKNTLKVSATLAHYDQIRKYNSADVVIGYYQYPVDPGFEALYFRNLNKKLSVGTGFCYQSGRISDFIFNQDRFLFTELSLPVLFNRNLKFNEKCGLPISSGVYGGKTFLIKDESLDSVNDWHENPDFDESWYSEDTYFLDFYMSIGYYYSTKQHGKILIEPYFKYRINTVWLNLFQKKLHYGIKLSYSLNF